MTNEEREKQIRIANMLIGTINDLKTPMLMYQVEKDVAQEALENYIKMLVEQQPTLDTRQRERQLEMEYQHGYDKGWEEGRKALERQPKQGRWIGETICSNCNYTKGIAWEFNYCPECGAYMR